MGRKNYFDKTVNCSNCGKEYIEILCEEDLPTIMVFYCQVCAKNLTEVLEKSGLGIKPLRKRKNAESKVNYGKS